ncbi:MAG: WD40 repeat domain-containing protein [Planctomycetota bacterium]|nr:WD40 repeat domain-containing protein [Planctomycetota bacterium]
MGRFSTLCLVCAFSVWSIVCSVGRADVKPVAFPGEFGHDLFAISPNGKLLALYSGGVLRIGETATGRIKLTDDRVSADLFQLPWFSDGKRILAAGTEIQIRDAASLKTIATIATPAEVRRCALSLDESLLAVGQPDGKVLLIDVQKKATIATFAGHSQPPNCLVWSRDSRKLFTAGGYGDRELLSWDVRLKKQIGKWPVSANEVNSFTISPDEKQLIVLADREKLTVLEAGSGRVVRTLTGASHASVIAVSPDGKAVVSSDENDLLFWDEQGRQSARLQGHDNWPNQIEFSRDGSLLVSGGGRSVLVWSLGKSGAETTKTYSLSGVEKHSLSTDGAPVQQVSLSPNGRWLAAAVDTEPAAQVYVWDAGTLELYEKLPAGSPPLLDAHFRDDSKLVFQHSAGEFVVWEAGRKKEMRRLPVADVDRRFGFSRGRNVIFAIGSVRGEIVIGGAKEGETRLRFPAHKESISSVDVTSNGKLAVSGSHDQTARIWDTATGKLVATLPKLRGTHMTYHVVQFSPDDNLVAAGNDRAVILWDVKQKKVLHRLSGHDGYCRCLDFSSDSQMLVTGGDDNLIRIWQVADGKQVAQLTGHTDMLTGVSLSPDQKTLASGSFDKTVKLWDVSEITRKIQLREGSSAEDRK